MPQPPACWLILTMSEYFSPKKTEQFSKSFLSTAKSVSTCQWKYLPAPWETVFVTKHPQGTQCLEMFKIKKCTHDITFKHMARRTTKLGPVNGLCFLRVSCLREASPIHPHLQMRESAMNSKWHYSSLRASQCTQGTGFQATSMTVCHHFALTTEPLYRRTLLRCRNLWQFYLQKKFAKPFKLLLSNSSG